MSNFTTFRKNYNFNQFCQSELSLVNWNWVRVGNETFLAIFEHCAFTTTFFLTQFFELFSALLHSKIMSSSYWAIRVFFYFRKWTQFVIFVAGWGSLVWHKKEAEKMQKWDKRESFGRVSKHTLSCFRKLAKKIYMTFHLTCPLPLLLYVARDL